MYDFYDKKAAFEKMFPFACICAFNNLNLIQKTQYKYKSYTV